jgi:hypothetical protein
MCAMHLCCFEAKWPSLMLKTWPKQLLGSLPLALALPGPSLAPEKTNTPSYFVAGSVTKKKSFVTFATGLKN